MVYLADPLDVLLIQVQGSGRIRLQDELTPQGQPRVVRMAFAGHNDQPYQSVARWLVDQGALTMVEDLFATPAAGQDAVLFDFATHEDYRNAVKREFDGIKVLFGEYQEALKKVYTTPVVPDPKPQQQ